jgi:hypothetical protein
MRLEFCASEGVFSDERDPLIHCLICGLSGKDSSGTEHYLNFQRGYENEDPTEDWGVHCEFDDQANGDYNCVSLCRLTRDTLEVELTHSADRRMRYTGVVVDVSGLEEPAFDAIRKGLPRIFRGTSGILNLS